MTGYRGCGKSTIGALVAVRLDLKFIDSDKWIEQNRGESIATIFEQYGEATFRNLESEQIRQLRQIEDACVVSLGGGAIVRQENRHVIRELGRTVWLQASAETLSDRISKDSATATQRPKLSKLGDLDEIRTILAQREAWYREVADMCISTESNTMLEVADRIVAWFSDQT